MTMDKHVNKPTLSPPAMRTRRIAIGMVIVLAGMDSLSHCASASQLYANQTGLPCSACHQPGQESSGAAGLNDYGRTFMNQGHVLPGSQPLVPAGAQPALATPGPAPQYHAPQPVGTLPPAACAPATYVPTILRKLDFFPSFNANWTPMHAPLCAVKQIPQEWDALMRLGNNSGVISPAPGPEFWQREAVLFLARVVGTHDGSDVSRVLQFSSLNLRPDNVLEASWAYTSQARSPLQTNVWIGVRIPKPVPPVVSYLENGQEICTLYPGTAYWRSPSTP